MRGKADLHVHSKYSGLSKILFVKYPDSISEPREILRNAELRGLDVVCITDHNSIRGGVEARKVDSPVDVVVGEEVSTADGEVLGLFLTEEVPRGMTAAETVDAIHSQGGIAVAPHPFSTHCSALGNKVFDLNLDGIEMLNSVHRDGYSDDIAQRLCTDSGKALTGGSDAHTPTMVGNAYTTFEGSTAEDLRRSLTSRTTEYGGGYATLRDIVWMTTNIALKLHVTVTKAIFRSAGQEDVEYAREIYAMRPLTKALALVGTTAIMAPSSLFLLSVIGNYIHKSRSRTRWMEIIKQGRKL
jgi:predicted metal-dependent phosphoesterase TrpH